MNDHQNIAFVVYVAFAVNAKVCGEGVVENSAAFDVVIGEEAVVVTIVVLETVFVIVTISFSITLAVSITFIVGVCFDKNIVYEYCRCVGCN